MNNWSRKNAEYRREYARNYYRDNLTTSRQRQVIKSAIRRARKRNAISTAFTVTQLQARWDYYAGKCWMCGVTATAMDHVKPLAKGGAHVLCNLRPSCKPCNSGKGDSWAGPYHQRWLW